MPLHLFKDRNFNLTTVAGLIIGVAMFGALAYLPTYLQMVTGANATQAGLLMIPMMAALLVTSIVSGQIVSRTGRYKWLPIVGTLGHRCRPVPAVDHDADDGGLDDLRLPRRDGPRARHEHADPHPDRAELVPGHARSEPRPRRTTTSARSAPRSAPRSSAACSSHASPQLLTERLPPAQRPAGVEQLASPRHLVQDLPAPIRDVIVGAYNDALTPVFLYMVPLVLIAAAVLLSS